MKLIVLLFCFVFILSSCNQNTENQNAEAELNLLKKENQKLKEKIDSLENHLYNDFGIAVITEKNELEIGETFRANIYLTVNNLGHDFSTSIIYTDSCHGDINNDLFYNTNSFNVLSYKDNLDTLKMENNIGLVEFKPTKQGPHTTCGIYIIKKDSFETRLPFGIGFLVK